MEEEEEEDDEEGVEDDMEEGDYNDSEEESDQVQEEEEEDDEEEEKGEVAGERRLVGAFSGDATIDAFAGAAHRDRVAGDDRDNRHPLDVRIPDPGGESPAARRHGHGPDPASADAFDTARTPRRGEGGSTTAEAAEGAGEAGVTPARADLEYPQVELWSPPASYRGFLFPSSARQVRDTLQGFRTPGDGCKVIVGRRLKSGVGVGVGGRGD